MSSEYLHRVFGPEAFSVDFATVPSGPTGDIRYEGTVDMDKAFPPLFDLTLDENGNGLLPVTQEQTGGHFATTLSTLPGSKMMQGAVDLVTMGGGTVRALKDIVFSKIVVPGDRLGFLNPENSQRVEIVRNKQSVAHVDVISGHNGLDAQGVGTLLEAAIQTHVATAAAHNPKAVDGKYPLVASVQFLTLMGDDDPVGVLRLHSSDLSFDAKRKFWISNVAVYRLGGGLVAAAGEIAVRFVTARELLSISMFQHSSG